jgi:Spy/CpxP family protein refolding chaperone
MKTNKVSLLAAVALSAAGLSFSTANAADSATTVDAGKSKAQCASGFRSHRGGFMKELGFTTDQLEKMNALKLSFENSNGPKKAELMKLHRELRDDITKPGVSKSELLSLQTKINAVRDDLSTSKISYMADKIALLTPDQQTKIREFSLKHSFGPGGGHHFKGRHHFGGGRSFQRGPGGPGGANGHRAFNGGDKAFGDEAPSSVAPPAPGA